MQQNDVYGVRMSKTETNTTTPPFTSKPDFDPQAVWSKMFADAQVRAQAFAEQYAQLEAQMMARAKQAIDTWAQLAQDALAYSTQLSAQARKLGFEAASKFHA
jgi:hypothetical protein